MVYRQVCIEICPEIKRRQSLIASSWYLKNTVKEYVESYENDSSGLGYGEESGFHKTRPVS